MNNINVFNASRRNMPSILVIDDKDSMRTMLSQTLQEEGFQVDTVEGGQKGLELVASKVMIWP